MTTSFDFPVTDFSNKPAQFVGNLTVSITYELRRGRLRTWDADEVTWNGMNVTSLIQAIAPDCWDEINQAAKSHIEGMYDNDFEEDEKMQNYRENAMI